MHVFLHTKSKTNFENYIYIYTKSQTLFKNQDNLRYVFIHKKEDTLRYAISREIFDIGIYIYFKSWHFVFRDVFIYKKPDTSKKQDNLRYVFYIQKA